MGDKDQSPSDSEEESITLPADTLAALKDFYRDKEQQESRFAELKAAAEDKANDDRVWSMDMFSEDWNASQFWYDDETAVTLARVLLDGASATTNILVISAPSVFVQLKNLLRQARQEHPDVQQPSITLFEYDNRFSVFSEFIFYDFQHPLQLDSNLRAHFDRILLDPPFLSPDCQTKVAMSARWLAKQAYDESTSKQQIVICTGERMSDLIPKIYRGVRATTFLPRHAQDRLSNDFRCYSNFENKQWSFS